MVRGFVILAALTAGLLAVSGNAAPAGDDGPAANPLSGNEKAIKEGRSWFRGVCAVCHGGRADGQGERGNGADLRKFNKGFQEFVLIVKTGRQIQGRTQNMPAWGAVLKEEQIYQIGAYLETLAIEGAEWKEGVHN